MKQEIKEWNGVAVRYPNELFLEENHAADALMPAGEILQWAKKMVEPIS